MLRIHCWWTVCLLSQDVLIMFEEGIFPWPREVFMSWFLFNPYVNLELAALYDEHMVAWVSIAVECLPSAEFELLEEALESIELITRPSL